jgi:hypothetical protein
LGLHRIKNTAVMAMMTLVLDSSKYNEKEQISAIFRSIRKLSIVRLEDVNVVGYKYYKIFGHFKEYIQEIEFDGSPRKIF